MRWILYSRRKKADPLVQHDTYLDLEMAKEFANELASFHRHYEAIVTDTAGQIAYSTRLAGIRPTKRKTK